MPENNLVDDRLLACEPVIVGAVTVLPIVRLSLQSQIAATHAWLAASKEPVALVIRDRDAVRAIHFGTPLSIEHLRAQIPELDQFIEPY